MEEIEISSWITLDAIKKKSEIIETVGNLQTGHSMSVFCQIEEDFLELVYSDSTSNWLRRFDDKDELEAAVETRKEEDGDAPYEEEREYEEEFESEDTDDEEERESLAAEEEADDY
jgi:hypothetical protein